MNHKQDTVGDTYDDDDETFPEFEEGEEDEENSLSHSHIHQNNHNSKIKFSSSASPIVSTTYQSSDLHQLKQDKLNNNNEQSKSNIQIPSISFDEPGLDHLMDENDFSSPSSPFSSKIPTQSVNVYSKFLTANNLQTERGGVVNIRTGSFNLGCQPDQLSDELTNSYEFFNSGDQSTFTRSLSNYSFKHRYALF